MTDPEADTRPLTAKQDIRYLEWIAKRVRKLSPAGRHWLQSWMRDTFGD